MQTKQFLRQAGCRTASVFASGVVIVCGCLAAANAHAGDNAPSKDELALGRELFTREWLPNDSRARGGDGLGPVFNDSSCVACHNLGGVGGAGPANKNVDIVSAFSQQQQRPTPDPTQLPAFVIGSLLGRPPGMRQPVSKADPKQDAEKLAKVHPGFRAARSVVLHRFGTDPAYARWRARLDGAGVFAPVARSAVDQIGPGNIDVEFAPTVTDAVPDSAAIAASQRAEQLKQQVRMAAFRQSQGGAQTQHGNFVLIVSQRNTSPLFGAGLIDSIPERALEVAAELKHADFPKVSGRVSRLADGKVGRFGWKGQKASLREFAMTACAVELGLNVPEHEQAGLALKPDYKAPGLDMNATDCDALVAFLKNLPPPVQRTPVAEPEAKILDSGKLLFAKAGCATCHAPKLAEVDGIYSDLLVHDMGPELGDTGNYGVFIPSPGDEGTPEPVPEITEAFGRSGQTPADAQKKITGATRLEWRTPPLWGFRDSGPYLHDGRAETLDQAVAFHGGEAEESTRRYFALSDAQRFQVTSFLKSLVAPE